MTDPIIRDLREEMIRKIIERIDKIHDLHDRFKDRDDFINYLREDASDGEIVEWYIRTAEIKPEVELVSRITTYSLDIPELGIHATVQVTYEESTGNEYVEVVSVEDEDGNEIEWDSDMEDIILEVWDRR